MAKGSKYVDKMSASRGARTCQSYGRDALSSVPDTGASASTKSIKMGGSTGNLSHSISGGGTAKRGND